MSGAGSSRDGITPVARGCTGMEDDHPDDAVSAEEKSAADREREGLAADLQRVLDLDVLAKRAYAAAESRGLDTHSLRYTARELGLDSGAWRGELLDLVREAWGQRVTLSPISMGGAWRVGDAYGWAGKSQGTEDEALVAVLEAAPQPGTVTT